MVTEAGGRLAPTHVSRRHEPSGVPRNHLPHALHPVLRRVEAGAAGPPASHAGHASFAPPYPEDREPRQDHRDGAISERPASAEDRAVPGHWEGDLLFGDRNSQIATLVERQTRYVMLVKLTGKDTETVVNALIKNARRLPRELYRSLTWDRGKEMAAHRRFTLATDIQVYFCDPHHPWQRGTNENTNGLLRQYFLKGIDISGISQAKLDAVARQLNERPRKTLGYEAPAERYRQTVASIG